MKRSIIISTIFLLTATITFGQISIQKEVVAEKEVLKPISFDSLTPFISTEKIYDLYKYIGYKLYFVPISKKYIEKGNPVYSSINYLFNDEEKTYKLDHKYKFEETRQFEIFKFLSKRQLEKNDDYKTLKQRYEDKFIVKSRLYKPTVILEKDYPNDPDGESYNSIVTSNYTNYFDVENKYYTIINITDQDGVDFSNSHNVKSLNDRVGTIRGKIRIYLRDDISNDTFYYFSQAKINSTSAEELKPISQNYSCFILAPYFEKLGLIHKGKYYVAKVNIENITSIKSGEKVDIKQNSIWKCDDVTLVETSDVMYPEPFYILEDSLGNKIKIKIHELVDEPSTFKIVGEPDSKFITYERYKEILEKARLSEEEINKKKIEQEDINAFAERLSLEFRVKKKEALIKKYGSKNGNLIDQGKVCIGMDKDMCLYSWGNPIDIYRTTIKSGTHEQWIYSYKHFLYFDNGILTGIQD